MRKNKKCKILTLVISMLLTACFTTNSKKYQPPPATGEARFQNPVSLGYFQIDDKDQYRMNDKVNKDDNSRYHIQTSLNYDQQAMGLYDLLSYITLCTFPCAFSYDNRLTYELIDRHQGDTRIANTTYANTTTVVTAIPVLGFLTAGRKDAKVSATFDDTLNFELSKMENLFVAYRQKIAAEEKAETAKWKAFDKRSIEAVLAFRDGAKSKALQQTITEYYDAELERAVRNYAIKKGVARNQLDLVFCDDSGCSDYRVFDTFRIAALANSETVAAGLDVSTTTQGNMIVITIKADTGDVTKIYGVKSGDNFMIKRLTSGKGIFQQSADPRAAGIGSAAIISAMAGKPTPDKMDYAFIDKMRK